jgi:[acyl-carrier-protein] S-malonyltransferase
MGRDLAAGCHDGALLATTGFVQPAVFAIDVAAARVLESEGVTFGSAAGHSLGEYAALVVAGALDLVPALESVVERGAAMQAAAEERPGTMTALIGPSPEEAAEICEIAGRGDVLAVANENAAKQTVLSGTVEAIERAEALARDRGARAIRLNVAGAFHSPLMQPALPRVREAVAALEIREPRFPIVPNVSGRPTVEPSAIRDQLSRHVVAPVRWSRSVAAMADAGAEAFVEAGPGDVLTKLVRRTVPGVAASAVGSPEEAKAFAAALASEGGPA